MWLLFRIKALEAPVCLLLQESRGALMAAVDAALGIGSV